MKNFLCNTSNFVIVTLTCLGLIGCGGAGIYDQNSPNNPDNHQNYWQVTSLPPVPKAQVKPVQAKPVKTVKKTESHKAAVKKTATAKEKPKAITPIMTVYSATWCAPCRALHAKLDANGVKYNTVDIDNNPIPADVQVYIRAHGIPAVKLTDGRIVGGEAF